MAIREAVYYLALREAQVKQEDIGAIAAAYRTAFAAAIAAFLISHHQRDSLREDLKRAIGVFLLAAFVSGWRQAGGGETIDAEDQLWIEARIAAEVGFSAALVETLSEIDTEGMIDDELRAIANERADGYTLTLYGIYNEGLLRGNRTVQLTFDGTDGQESCKTCQSLKGARHPARWWVEHHLIPGQPGNPNYICRGYLCQHYLRKDNGERYTEFFQSYQTRIIP